MNTGEDHEDVQEAVRGPMREEEEEEEEEDDDEEESGKENEKAGKGSSSE